MEQAGCSRGSSTEQGLLPTHVLLLVLLFLVVGLGAAHVLLILLFFCSAETSSTAKDIAVPRPNVRNAARAMKKLG
jgi:hypothetical protein